MNNATIYLGDNLDILRKIPDKTVKLIYTDPPFNTKKKQTGKSGSYTDTYDDYLAWIKPRLEECKRILTDDGSIFIHLDYREVHYVKVLCDSIFGRESFINSIVWHYDFGARQKNKWATKHDDILWYAKNPKKYVFNYNEVDTIPKLAVGLPVSKNRVDPDVKKVTDVWWCTIVPTNGKERTGYPTQKPIKILNRIIKVHSNPGDTVLDFCCGSGTTGEAAIRNNRNTILIDANQEAVNVTYNRLCGDPNTAVQIK
jgi:site-specific DNA-methyltransferase (adenine-specific)